MHFHFIYFAAPVLSLHVYYMSYVFKYTDTKKMNSVKHLFWLQWDSENIYLILEWCSGGDLSRFIRSRRILPERVARLFLQQIGEAGVYTITLRCN